MKNKVMIAYHKVELRRLMLQYRSRLSSLDCGHELAQYMLTDVNELEQKMDEHIAALNKLDNKNFKLFSEGYAPLGVIN